MSKLSYWGRPWAIFDSSNKQHRRWFTEFQRTRTWGHCPVRFVVDDEQGNLITMMQQQMIDYYVNKEFKRPTDQTKAQRKPRKKHVSA